MVCSSEIWALIGVVVGVILGLGLELLRDWIKDKNVRKKYLEDLLADFEYNKKLAEEGSIWGYHTLGYTDAKSAKYLFDLPENLRTQVYDSQSIISDMYRQREKLGEIHPDNIKRLGVLLEKIIPELKRHLKK